MEPLEFLQKVPLFRKISPEALGRLIPRLRRRSYHKDEIIFHQEDLADRLFLIVQGTVKISLVSEDGREKELARLGSGEFFGEMAILDGGPRSATAVAAEPVETLTLLRPDFTAFLSENPSAATEIIVLLARRLRTTNELLGNQVFLDVPARVAKRLVEMAEAEPQARDTEGRIVVPCRQDELASLIGATRESVSKALAAYRKMGLLTTAYGHIAIARLDGLRNMAFL